MDALTQLVKTRPEFKTAHFPLSSSLDHVTMEVPCTGQVILSYIKDLSSHPRDA